jgi:hypothetical protein
MKEKMYTLAEIAAMEGLSVNGIRQRFWKAHGDKTKVMTHITFDRAGFRHSEMLFTAQQLIEFHLLGPKRHKKSERIVEKPKARVVQNLEELKALHPLVKDEKFFDSGYFPDVIPTCFMTEE